MIRVKNLSYTYADAQSKILDNIKIVLKPGKIVLLAGPTGSGKSTLALLIAGILQRHGHGILTWQLNRILIFQQTLNL